MPKFNSFTDLWDMNAGRWKKSGNQTYPFERLDASGVKSWSFIFLYHVTFDFLISESLLKNIVPTLKSWNPGQIFLDHVLIKWGQPLIRDKFFKEWFWFMKSRNGDNMGVNRATHHYIVSRIFQILIPNFLELFSLHTLKLSKNPLDYGLRIIMSNPFSSKFSI